MNIERVMDVLSTGTILIITARAVRKDLAFFDCLIRAWGTCCACIFFSMYFGLSEGKDREWVGSFYIISHIACSVLCIYVNEYIRTREHLHKHFDAVWLGYIALLNLCNILSWTVCTR